MPLTFGTPFVFDTLVADVGTEGSIRSWGSHAAIPAVEVLVEAQAWIYGILRAREMIVVNTSYALAANTVNIALETGWQEDLFLRLDGDDMDLELRHESWVSFKQSDGTYPTGKPSCYTVLDQIYFDYQTDTGPSGTGYTGQHAYYGTPAALGSSNQSNFLCTRFPTLLRMVSTAYAYQSRRRLTDANDMFQMAQAEIARCQVIEDGYRRGMLGLRSAMRGSG
jgi:hypothetical protein